MRYYGFENDILLYNRLRKCKIYSDKILSLTIINYIIKNDIYQFLKLNQNYPLIYGLRNLITENVTRK